MNNDNEMEVEIINLGTCPRNKLDEGFAAAIQAAKTLNCSTTIVVGSKAKYPMRLIGSFLGENNSELLKMNERVVLNDGSVLRLESIHTIARASTMPVLFLVYGWREAIPKIKRAIGVKKLTVLVQNEDEVSLWGKEFGEKSTT